MRGSLSIEALLRLEVKIDAKLNGRDANSTDLEATLKSLIGKYSYEVEYYNILHTEPYVNKYGTTTPPEMRPWLSLANFLANGAPAETKDVIVPKSKYPITHEIMTSYVKSIESVLKGHPSRKEQAEVVSYDPLLSNLNPS